MAAVEDLDGGADGPREGRRGEEGAEADGADAEAEAVVELPEEDREERRVLEEIGRADRRAIARVPLRQPRVAEHVRAQRLDQPRPQRRRVAHRVPSERLGPRHTRLRDASVRAFDTPPVGAGAARRTLDHPGGPLAAAAHAAAEARGEGGGLRRRRGAGGDRQEVGVIVDPILLAAVDADLGRKVVVTPERLQRARERVGRRAQRRRAARVRHELLGVGEFTEEDHGDCVRVGRHVPLHVERHVPERPRRTDQLRGRRVGDGEVRGAVRDAAVGLVAGGPRRRRDRGEPALR